MRILVTGSRDWTNEAKIREVMLDVTIVLGSGPHTLVSGACPTGADYIAEKFASEMGYEVERYPANWAEYGKSAGFIRNAQMVETEPDLCIAFIKHQSKGASHTVELAEKAGVMTWKYEAN